MKPILLVLLAVGSILAMPPTSSKQYRDYIYNSKTDAFYKLHPESRDKYQATKICGIEGAKLMVVENQEDIVQVHGMLKKYPDIGEFVAVSSDGVNHDEADEKPIIELSEEEDPTSRWSPSESTCDVIDRRGEVKTTPCYYRHPFVCKVAATEAPYDEHCDVYATGYTYYDDVKSCYKVPQMALAWEEAVSACKHENAHLVVINSASESARIEEFLKTAPVIIEAEKSYFFFAGIRANMPTDGSERVFKTIFNQTLEEAGFAGWARGEPNNHNNEEYCGSIFSNVGLYNDVNCDHLFGYICEKEVPHA
ncbi:lectin c-type domain-containing protein [Phthorimaea operculella]|nr:lectin c-type domain-containing protein [Phthorimaea operculella]